MIPILDVHKHVSITQLASKSVLEGLEQGRLLQACWRTVSSLALDQVEDKPATSEVDAAGHTAPNTGQEGNSSQDVAAHSCAPASAPFAVWSQNQLAAITEVSLLPELSVTRICQWAS
jgi:hypothetical protein